MHSYPKWVQTTPSRRVQPSDFEEEAYVRNRDLFLQTGNIEDKEAMLAYVSETLPSQGPWGWGPQPQSSPDWPVDLSCVPVKRTWEEAVWSYASKTATDLVSGVVVGFISLARNWELFAILLLVGGWIAAMVVGGAF